MLAIYKTILYTKYMKKEILDIIKMIIPYITSFLLGKSMSKNKAKERADELTKDANSNWDAVNK